MDESFTQLLSIVTFLWTGYQEVRRKREKRKPGVDAAQDKADLANVSATANEDWKAGKQGEAARAQWEKEQKR